jgi:hypothetical protein
VAHPFVRLSPGARRRAFFAATALTLAVGAALSALGAPLATPAAPRGIVSFELAGSLAESDRILASWDERARVAAGFVQGLDYLFLVAYAAAIGLGCARAADALRPRAPRAAALGDALAWGQLAAGALDAVENAALVALLLGGRSELLAPLAAACAIPKFALVAAGLLYAGIGAVWHRTTPRRKRGAP